MKKYILVAGVNGAGKSTLYQSLQSLHDIPRVNTDEILREFGDWRNMIDVMAAGKMAVKKIARYFDEGITFNQETTLCGKSILSNIAKAKKRGYFIELHYIGVENAHKVLSCKLDAPAPCRLDAPDFDVARWGSADCLHQHQQVI